MSRFKPHAWYEAQQPDDDAADDADTAGIRAAQERLRRWMGLPDEDELDDAEPGHIAQWPLPADNALDEAAYLRAKDEANDDLPG